MSAQRELFENSDAPARAPAPSQKLFRGANGVELPYWEEDGKIIRIALSDKLILDVTQQKGGHIYANDPGRWGRIERKNKISFLSAAAQIRRAIEINDSMQGSLKEQGKLLRAALETHQVAPARERSVNKLASRATGTAGALHFFNPKPLLNSWRFSPVPTWLVA